MSARRQKKFQLHVHYSRQYAIPSFVYAETKTSVKYDSYLPKFKLFRLPLTIRISHHPKIHNVSYLAAVQGRFSINSRYRVRKSFESSNWPPHFSRLSVTKNPFFLIYVLTQELYESEFVSPSRTPIDYKYLLSPQIHNPLISSGPSKIFHLPFSSLI